METLNQKQVEFLEYLEPTDGLPKEMPIRSFMVKNFDKPKDLSEQADNYKDPAKEFLLDLLDMGLIEANRTSIEQICSKHWLDHRGEDKFQYWFHDYQIEVKIADVGLDKIKKYKTRDTVDKPTHKEKLHNI
jgi:hypothetical protein